MHKSIRAAFQLSCSLLGIGGIWALASTAVFADQYFDAGLKSFKVKNYTEAARYFEQSIKNAPWESNSFYYCALTYHYKGDFKSCQRDTPIVQHAFPELTPATRLLLH